MLAVDMPLTYVPNHAALIRCLVLRPTIRISQKIYKSWIRLSPEKFMKMKFIFQQSLHPRTLFPEQSPYSFEHTILLRIVRMIFTRDLQDSRESIGICIHSMSDLFGNLPFHKQINVEPQWHVECGKYRTGSHIRVD